MPGFGGCDLFYAMAVPEASGASEGGESAFGGDPGAGQDEEAVLGGEAHGGEMLVQCMGEKRVSPLRITRETV